MFKFLVIVCVVGLSLSSPLEGSDGLIGGSDGIQGAVKSGTGIVGNLKSIKSEVTAMKEGKSAFGIHNNVVKHSGANGQQAMNKAGLDVKLVPVMLTSSEDIPKGAYRCQGVSAGIGGLINIDAANCLEI